MYSQLDEKWLYYVRSDNFFKRYNRGELWLYVYWTGKGVDTSGYFVSAPQPIFILGEFLVKMFVGGMAPHYIREG